MNSRVPTLALAAISCFALCGALLPDAASAQAAPASKPAVVRAPVGAKPGEASPELDKQLAQIEDATTVIRLIDQMRRQGAHEAEMKAWERLVQLRPHIGRYRYEMAARYAERDQKTNAYNALLELQAQGYDFDARDDKRFAPVATTEVWEYIAQGLEANDAKFGEARLAYTLPKDDLLLESIAWDASRKELLAGSARDGAVYRVGKDGKLTPFIKADEDNGLWAVFDLVVDDKRGVLWIASTAMPHFKDYDAEQDLGRAGIFKFDLKTGKFLKKFLSPTIVGQNYILSSIALGKDGEVYAADGVNNAVYQVRDDKFQRLFHAPRLSSIRGIAVSGDGKLLYLGDHELGVIGYDLATGKPFDVTVPKNLSLGLIEGIAWTDGKLVVVQNNLPPSRIMRLTLAPNGRSIESVNPLSANDPLLSTPTLGTLAGDTFYVVANSQKDNYDRFGLLRDKDKLQATRIVSVDVDYEPPVDTRRPQLPNLRPAGQAPGDPTRPPSPLRDGG